MYNPLQETAGEFQHAETNCWFTYTETEDPVAQQWSLPYAIDVLDGVRFARVLKTVAYVATDENPDGTPFFEKWKIKNHKQWNVKGKTK